ncbi:MAG: hypothetical protein SOS98_01590 [Varibaculum sp.]|nr:hypothetical protein [Varibaculum sp.]
MPDDYLLTQVVYADPSLNVTPSTGEMQVTGTVADIAQNGNGMEVPIIEANSVTF